MGFDFRRPLHRIVGAGEVEAILQRGPVNAVSPLERLITTLASCADVGRTAAMWVQGLRTCARGKTSTACSSAIRAMRSNEPIDSRAATRILCRGSRAG
jgi:hypothetical protein